MTVAEPPWDVPGFDLHEQLGEGGYGVVFRATQESVAGIVRAVKILMPPATMPDEDVETRFEREVESLAKLHHPGIVSYVTSGWTTGERRPYLVLDYVKGDSLRAVSGEMHDRARVAAVRDAALALAYAHKKDVIHRDIRPANVMVREDDGVVVIVDWGQAYLFEGETSETLTSRHIGTSGYVPPEVQADPKHREPSHDIFSLGVTLYEILGGRRPNNVDYELLSNVRGPELAGLDAVIRACIGREADRPSATKLAERLSVWVERAAVREELGSSTKLSAFRQGLVAKTEEDRQRREARAAAQQALQELWEAAHTDVCVAAETALNEILDTVADVVDGSEFEERDVVAEAEGEPRELMARRGPHFELVLALSARGERPLGRLGSPVKALITQKQVIEGKTGKRVTRKGVPPSSIPKMYEPVWVLYKESNRQSPRRIAIGAVALVRFGDRPPVLYGAPDIDVGKAVELKDANAVRDYFFGALAPTFGVRHLL